MTPLARWLRFNMVGIAGFAVQMLTLAALDRWSAAPTAVAVTLAVLAAVSHNFLWHERVTWPGTAARRALATLALFQPVDWRRLGDHESDRDDDRSRDHWSTAPGVEHDRGCDSIARELLGERSSGVCRSTRNGRDEDSRD